LGLCISNIMLGVLPIQGISWLKIYPRFNSNVNWINFWNFEGQIAHHHEEGRCTIMTHDWYCIHMYCVA
jgi:hypothetical protein